MLTTTILPTPPPPTQNPSHQFVTPSMPMTNSMPNNPPQQPNSIKSTLLNKPVALGMMALGITALGIVAALLLSTQNQDTRKDASGAAGTVEVSVSPTTKEIPVGETSQPFTVYLNTKNRLITGVSVRLSYPHSGSTPLVTASRPTALINQGSGGSWNCPITQTNVAASQVNIDFGCVYQDTAGFTNNTNAPLFSFTLTAGQTATTSPISITFDNAETMATDKASGEDVAMIPTTRVAVSVTGNTTPASPTPTPTGRPSATSTPTPTAPAATATQTPTPTTASTTTSSDPNYTCNHTCTANRDCQSSLACLGGYCRDPRCQSDSSCKCENKDVASQNGTTTLPQTGGAPYIIWLSIIGGLLIFSGVNFGLWLKNGE